jgi:hypothetical protein
VKRNDTYVIAIVTALLLSSWYVGSAIRRQAAATLDLASAVDCTSEFGRDESNREDCEEGVFSRGYDAAEAHRRAAFIR